MDDCVVTNERKSSGTLRCQTHRLKQNICSMFFSNFVARQEILQRAILIIVVTSGGRFRTPHYSSGLLKFSSCVDCRYRLFSSIKLIMDDCPRTNPARLERITP